MTWVDRGAEQVFKKLSPLNWDLGVCSGDCRAEARATLASAVG